MNQPLLVLFLILLTRVGASALFTVAFRLLEFRIAFLADEDLARADAVFDYGKIQRVRLSAHDTLTVSFEIGLPCGVAPIALGRDNTCAGFSSQRFFGILT